MTSRNKSFLGKGWKFPIRINSRGGLSYSRGDEDIEEAIWIILGTSMGERIMLPEFYCGIHDLVFAPLNPTIIGDIEFHVKESLIKWEHRIDVLDVRVEQEAEEPNKLLIRVDYRIRANNAYYNMVYPFCYSEGVGS